VIAGARERLRDDDALLEEIGAVLDSLFAHFANGKSAAKGRAAERTTRKESRP
jgi:hypothetical protein